MNNRTTPEANRLLLEGSLALAEMEHAGIRIDVDYLNATIEKVGQRIWALEQKLQESEVFQVWKKRFGNKTKLDSRPQLGEVLFDDLKIPYPGEAKTSTGRWATDEEILTQVKHPFVGLFLKTTKLKKLQGTYLKGVLREVCDGYLHPMFDLHTARSYRSSSSNPNFQNIPIREPKLGELIRRAFIARDGHHLVEIDFKGAEVCISCAYHKDPKLIAYQKNSKLDMHRDVAMQLYFIDDPKDVGKEIRNQAKGNFTFAQFYGSYYVQCAKKLWAATSEHTVSGKSVKELLAEHGIKKLGDCNPEYPARAGTFEKHVQDIERDFWNNRFPVYRKWKDAWYKEYLRNQGFLTLTGFWVNPLSGESGVLSKNDATNYPIQGSSFHCLLWTLIQVQRWLRKNKMKTKLVGQIHDSLVADAHKDELQDYLAKVQELVTVDLPKYWQWINVPMKVECGVSPLGASWWDKQDFVLNDAGLWVAA